MVSTRLCWPAESQSPYSISAWPMPLSSMVPWVNVCAKPTWMPRAYWDRSLISWRLNTAKTNHPQPHVVVPAESFNQTLARKNPHRQYVAIGTMKYRVCGGAQEQLHALLSVRTEHDQVHAVFFREAVNFARRCTVQEVS